MDFSGFFQQYWPLVLVALWFGYKWWNARRVVAMLPELKSRGAVVVDVRSEAEFASGHAPESINIPLDALSGRLQEIPDSVPVVLCCASGTRSAMAKLMLKKRGYKQVYNVGKWANLPR